MHFKAIKFLNIKVTIIFQFKSNIINQKLGIVCCWSTTNLKSIVLLINYLKLSSTYLFIICIKVNIICYCRNIQHSSKLNYTLTVAWTLWITLFIYYILLTIILVSFSTIILLIDLQNLYKNLVYLLVQFLGLGLFSFNFIIIIIFIFIIIIIIFILFVVSLIIPLILNFVVVALLLILINNITVAMLTIVLSEDRVCIIPTLYLFIVIFGVNGHKVKVIELIIGRRLLRLFAEYFFSIVIVGPNNAAKNINLFWCDIVSFVMINVEL